MILLLCALSLATLAGGYVARSAVARLEEFEAQVVRCYSDEGVLNNARERDAVLDEVEAFLDANEEGLLVMRYERATASIHVTYLFGFQHVFQPLVEGVG